MVTTANRTARIAACTPTLLPAGSTSCSSGASSSSAMSDSILAARLGQFFQFLKTRVTVGDNPRRLAVPPNDNPAEQSLVRDDPQEQAGNLVERNQGVGDASFAALFRREAFPILFGRRRCHPSGH